MQGMAGNFLKEMSGPAQPVVDRIRNQYLWEVLIKLPKDVQKIQQCKREIMQQIVIIQSNKRYKTVRVVLNVDPL